MRVLVIGSGAREHALVARLCVDPQVSVSCAPGNPGIAELVETHPVDQTDPTQLLCLAEQLRADLAIVGPELPLSLGVADHFAAAGRLLLGPTAAAARLETSKAFAKDFMARHGVPTARFHVAESEADALAFVRANEFGLPVVLKADGLAAGKGVVIAQTLDEAERAITAAMSGGRFGAAGRRLVIEECLSGPEVSFFVLSDGTRVVPLGTAQDHKRIFDDDRGPNTGGMGAFAPSPLITPALHDEVMRDIVHPVVAGMAGEGCPFRGFLYVGLMLTPAGPRVIEFNTRLGDPETQVILPRIAEPLAPLFAAAAAGALTQEYCALTDAHVVGVVLASRGYPDSAESGRPITGVADARARGVSVMHAGTAMTDGQLVTSGGRVLTVVAAGASFAQARSRAYDGVRAVHFDGMQYRSDIGLKAMQESEISDRASETQGP